MIPQEADQTHIEYGFPVLSPRPSWHRSCNLFTTMIGNLLHFLEYFNEKVNSMKNVPLGFVEVQSTHLFFGFLNKCRKI